MKVAKRFIPEIDSESGDCSIVKSVEFENEEDCLEFESIVYESGSVSLSGSICYLLNDNVYRELANMIKSKNLEIKSLKEHSDTMKGVK